jgi:acyl-homoserine lactone acylase PvdQ
VTAIKTSVKTGKSITIAAKDADQSAAIKEYARQAKDKNLISWATEINLRAKRKAGEMLAKMAKEGKRSKGRRKKLEESHSAILFSPTLADIGVDATQSSNWQKLAAIPDEQFEKDVIVASELASGTIDQ